MDGSAPDERRLRLPDGSVRRHAEATAESTAAEALAAADLLVAAAMKAAEEVAAAEAAAVQQSTANVLAERYRVTALDASEKARAAVEAARRQLAEQEAVAAERRQLARETAAKAVEAAEIAAAHALEEVDERLLDAPDDVAARRIAGQLLADARQRAARTLADALLVADSELAAQARLAAAQLETEATAARAEQAEELAAAQAVAAAQFAVAHATAAERVVAAHAAAAEEVERAARTAAERLAAAHDKATQELIAAEEQFRLVMDWAGVAACTVSVAGRFLRVNEAMCKLLGRSEDELLGETLQDVTHPDDLEVLTELMSSLPTGERGSFRTLNRYVAADGQMVWGDLSVAAVLNPDGTVSFHIAQIVDLTERVKYEEALAVMATHDALTGLANRNGMLDEITRALSNRRRSSRATAVLAMDLDHFKLVNDTMGHDAGDQLLKAASTRIENVMRSGDLAARPGGDEFVIVMRDLDDPTDAVRVAGRLVEAFRQPLLIDGVDLFATVSIGVAIDADATRAVEAGDLLREADTAMYAAKAQGRDRVSVYDEGLRTIVTERLAVETDLRRALERGQLEVWYQPEVDLATGAVIAVEALLRWHHPDGTVWNADRFIDVAEDSGLILDIGDWVLRTACDQGAAWATARPDRRITVRVNKSALQIAGIRLLPTLDETLAGSGLDPALLCIEITETALLRETATARDNLAGIHDRGVSIAIDDFGTGYASLLYLRRYPIDVIKIDRSFVTDITTDNHDRAISAAVVALANALDLTVTAEGVELPEQATILRDMGCPGAQGWLYSKAVPADEVTGLLDHIYPHS